MKKVRLYTKEDIAEARIDLFEEQRGLCAICDRELDRPIPDHCHRHGIIRGLLCAPCNSGLGMFSDSIDNLLSAINYLREAQVTIAEVEATEGDDRERLRKWRLHNQTRDQQKRAEQWATERRRTRR